MKQSPPGEGVPRTTEGGRRLGGKKAKGNRKVLVHKAGKSRAPYQAPPTGNTRSGIIERTSAWVDWNPTKARTTDIKESVVSQVDGFPELRLDFIPGFPRWDLDRAMRRTAHTAKGNRTNG